MLAVCLGSRVGRIDEGLCRASTITRLVPRQSKQMEGPVAEKSEHERIVEVEMGLTHVQRDFESLNEVMLEQQKTIEALQRTVQRLESRLQSVTDPEVRDPESERPPHY